MTEHPLDHFTSRDNSFACSSAERSTSSKHPAVPSSCASTFDRSSSSTCSIIPVCRSRLGNFAASKASKFDSKSCRFSGDVKLVAGSMGPWRNSAAYLRWRVARSRRSSSKASSTSKKYLTHQQLSLLSDSFGSAVLHQRVGRSGRSRNAGQVLPSQALQQVLCRQKLKTRAQTSHSSKMDQRSKFVTNACSVHGSAVGAITSSTRNAHLAARSKASVLPNKSCSMVFSLPLRQIQREDLHVQGTLPGIELRPTRVYSHNITSVEDSPVMGHHCVCVPRRLLRWSSFSTVGSVSHRCGDSCIEADVSAIRNGRSGHIHDQEQHSAFFVHSGSRSDGQFRGYDVVNTCRQTNRSNFLCAVPCGKEIGADKKFGSISRETQCSSDGIRSSKNESRQPFSSSLFDCRSMVTGCASTVEPSCTSRFKENRRRPCSLPQEKDQHHNATAPARLYRRQLRRVWRMDSGKQESNTRALYCGRTSSSNSSQSTVRSANFGNVGGDTSCRPSSFKLSLGTDDGQHLYSSLRHKTTRREPDNDQFIRHSLESLAGDKKPPYQRFVYPWAAKLGVRLPVEVLPALFSLDIATLGKYAKTFSIFTTWLHRRNLRISPLTVLKFIATSGDPYYTFQTWSALKFSLRIKGVLSKKFPGAIASFDEPLFFMSLKGIQRRSSHTYLPLRLPLRWFHLLEISKLSHKDGSWLRDMALLSLGFLGMLRASEILSLEDHAFSIHEDFLSFSILRKKVNLRQTLTIRNIKGLDIDFVGIIKSFLLDHPGKLFPFLTTATVSAIVQSRLRQIGLFGKFSSHSLRIGGATFLAECGKSSTLICSIGGWSTKSSTLHRYIRDVVQIFTT